MRWVDALKIFNKDRGSWCIPRKNTVEYKEVIDIMKGKSKTKTKEATEATKGQLTFKSAINKIESREKRMKQSLIRMSCSTRLARAKNSLLGVVPIFAYFVAVAEAALAADRITTTKSLRLDHGFLDG